MRKKLFIHGGSSLLSKYLIKKFSSEFDDFYIFCRNIEKTKQIIDVELYKKEKNFYFFSNDLNNLDETIKDIEKLPLDFRGIIWVTGSTGNPDEEFLDYKKARENINVNFTNTVLCLTILTKKILLEKNSFICAITSVAGLRGRSKRLYYSAAKGGLINFMSGLRQFYKDKIKIITVIPGYISTNSFTEKSSKFLITTPEKAANTIFNSIQKNKEIVYISFLWRYIMMVINLIPEKVFKKLNF
tara:strand:- start:56 stop:784 length:729 start_codon:yes stop_codon:yes gene_type:complete